MSKIDLCQFVLFHSFFQKVENWLFFLVKSGIEQAEDNSRWMFIFINIYNLRNSRITRKCLANNI